MTNNATPLQPVTDEATRLRDCLNELADARERLKQEAAARRQAETALRDNEGVSRQMLDSIRGLIALVTADGELQFANQQLLEYTGRTLEELKQWGTNDTVHAEDLPNVLDVFSRSIASGSRFDIELRLRRSDGVYRWFHNSGVPLRDATGHIGRWTVLMADIDERKRAEDALRESERELRLIVNTIPGLVAIATASGEVEVVNEQLTEYCGQNLEAMKQADTNGIIHVQDQPRLAPYREAIANGTPFDFEARLRRFDDVYRWFQFRGLPLRDTNDQIVRWYSLVTDIDDRKRAEDALRASERSLKLIIDTIPAMAWSAFTDASGEFVNQHYIDFTGLSADQASGSGWASAVHPDDLDGLIQTWRQIMATEAAGEFEARLRRHDGAYRWFLHRVNPLRDESGATVKWYGVSTDIEDRKQAEQERRRSEALLTEAQLLSRVGSFWWRVATDEITWSEQLYRIFEIEPDTRVTLDVIEDRVHKEDLSAFQEQVERSRRDGCDVQLEIRLQMPDRTVKYVHILAHCREENSQREFIGAVQDVTRRRLSEEALAKVRSELAFVARSTSLGVLTASIAHEVNQPLTGIVTNAGTCLKMLNAVPPNIDSARETARRTIRDGHRAADVMTRLRALFSKKEFTLELVDLSEATREVIALSLSDLQRNRVELHSELADNLPPVMGDRIQLQQVILNLLRNASEAMCEVHDQPRVLTIKTERDIHYRVRVTVRDVGIGLSPDTMDSLFDAFHSTKSGGMGIGLFVSRSIIETHHGRLWAEPNNGPGATFSFVIPLQTV